MCFWVSMSVHLVLGQRQAEWLVPVSRLEMPTQALFHGQLGAGGRAVSELHTHVGLEAVSLGA